MKRLLAVLLMAVMCAGSVAYAKGGFSGGGGSRGGFSSGGSRSFSSAPSRSYSTPAARPSAPSVSRSTTTTTTRSYASRGTYGGGMMYGGMGMGYGYSNGILTGLIIGSMMHPQGTMMYSGPGMYANNALLYPDGRVVTANGQLVGTYQNGQYNAVANGPIVAQPAPSDPPQQATPVVIQDNTNATLAGVLGIVLMLFLFVVLMRIIL